MQQRSKGTLVFALVAAISMGSTIASLVEASGHPALVQRASAHLARALHASTS